MEQMNLFSTIIGNLGVPIGCLCGVFYLWNQERQDHKEESERWVKALENNTQVLANNTCVMERILEKVK